MSIPNAEGFIDQPLRKFRIELTETRAEYDPEDETTFPNRPVYKDIEGHSITPTEGVLYIIRIAHGIAYVTDIFAPGTWKHVSCSIPSAKEILDLKERANETIAARQAFENMKPGVGKLGSN